MKPFSDIKADGTLRVRGKRVLRVHAALKKAVTQAKRTNGRPPYRRVGTRVRRLEDLMRNYLADFPEPDEAALGLARTAAIASMKVERYEAMEVKGETVDDELFVRVAGQLSRSLTALRLLKPKSRPASEQPKRSSSLQLHLEAMARRRDEKARLEAEGTAAAEAR